MAVTALTHQMIAREGAAMLAEEMHFSTRINRGRESEFTETVNGYKKGDTIGIKVPAVPNVYDGATFAGGGSAPAFTELNVPLTLDTQKHVPLTYGAKEKLLEMTEFKERFLRPSIRALAAVVEADMILRAQKLCPNLVGTPGTTPTTAKTYAQARAQLQRFLAPETDRTLLITSEANIEMVDASKALFNPVPSIAKQYSEGAVKGMFQGAVTFESVNMVPYGNGADIAMTVNGASQTGSTLTVAGNTAVTKGQIFTLPGVFAVHPLSGQVTSSLQQFVVTADSSGATISIYPPIQPSATVNNRTVSNSPTDTSALTFVGSASTTYARSFMFHRDAYTTAFAPLPVLASCEGYTATIDGLSLRVMTFGDGKADEENTRIDVLYGLAAPRPLHASLIIQ